MENNVGLTLLVLALCLIHAGGALAQDLYWTESTFAAPKLRKATSTGDSPTSLALSAGSLPQGVVFDRSGASVYWAELAITDAHINVSSSVPDNPQAILGGGSGFRGLALDLSAGKVYWTATNLLIGSRICRANLNGTSVDTLIKWSPGCQETPRGIALDVDAGKMYWADFNLRKICRANLDDSTVEDIVSNLSGPVGLQLDVEAGKMYWTEANGKTIKSSTMNGAGITTLVTTTGTPNYLVVDLAMGKMYWTEIGIPRINSAGIDGQSVSTLPVEVSNPAGIWIQSPPPLFVRSNVKVFLQGPYTTTTDEMENTLRTGGDLATHFDVQIPTNAVDSITVEIRDSAAASKSTNRLFQPAWLLKNGTIVSFYDSTMGYTQFSGAAAGDYFIVVWHRNHLAVMSSSARALSGATPAAYDFTTSQSQAYGSNAMVQVGSVFALVAGDATGNGQIQNSDINDLTRPNLGRGTQVP